VKGSILIVEDEPGIELALRGLLRRDGYVVSAVGSGREAFEQIERKQFDLILTDLSLGDGVTGMDVLQRSKQANPETAVIMITAYGSEHVAEQAVRAGADAYVPKPFDNDEIREAVRRALAGHR
jgi:two-component system response regulator PilR (NtrC family)